MTPPRRLRGLLPWYPCSGTDSFIASLSLWGSKYFLWSPPPSECDAEIISRNYFSDKLYDFNGDRLTGAGSDSRGRPAKGHINKTFDSPHPDPAARSSWPLGNAMDLNWCQIFRSSPFPTPSPQYTSHIHPILSCIFSLS